ncbi:sulfatase-like hydrolase/transferase [Streptococcus moroccensis]|uniref:Arylsulfatase A-like enzyme n=1 Tax=Streptococcus moroccensis TaxID=1451356 RepID=A0ABT9YRH0_9STRE|nr:sulfatase-like hydrolase/transferase [Streptococcus moroccensis]MDQ0222596.1 arylsulfatase A-like enzyme [Streptococcus moroccensis]
MTSKKPNIIILNPDEMRLDTLSHMGNEASYTPFLDDFALNEGVSFSNAFCQNPVCVPSRCSFLTGLYPHTRGHRTMSHLLQENETSLFKELKDAGYYVWMNGRNDLLAGQVPGLIESHADEIYYGKNKDVSHTETSPYVEEINAKMEKVAADPYTHYELLETELHSSDTSDTDAAIERILNPIDADKPLCLFIGWMNPHVPYVTSEKYRRLIDDTKLTKRALLEESTGKSLMIHAINKWAGLDYMTEEEWTEIRATYLAQCAYIDEQFNRICDALKEAGEYDNSAIFFLSDHGDFAGDFGLPEKAQNTFEHSLVNVPLLIKPPKTEDVDQGVSESLVELIDFYATVMDYAGVEPSEDHFGKSLRPIIEERSKTVRDYVFSEGGRNPYETQASEWLESDNTERNRKNAYWPKKRAQSDPESHEKGTMIFDGRYKYIKRASGLDEFYDLKEDPQELHNRIADPDLKEYILALQMEMLDWYQKTADAIPRQKDRRFSNQRVWDMVSTICPPDKEEKVREMIASGLPLAQIMTFCKTT